MNRNDVDDNPNNHCSHGLHVARYNYAYNWDDKTVIVKINPRDVVCVPDDYDGEKMRVCKYEVLKECDKQLTDTVYPENKHDDDKLGVYEYCDNCGFSVDDDNYCGCCDTYNK